MSQERDYCTILDVIAKDGGYDDFVHAIHMACLSSVLTTKRRIVLIPPERKGLSKKDPTEPLRQLIIPFIRGLKKGEPITEASAIIDGTQLVAIEASAAYDVSGSGSKAKIGGAKISKILHARNGIALILDSNPVPSVLVEVPKPVTEPSKKSKKGGGGPTLVIGDWSSSLGDGKATLYISGLNGPDLRSAIVTFYQKQFPPPLRWYDHFSSSFLAYMRYNDSLFRTYTYGINPYRYYYRTIISRPSYVSTGAILMPYLQQRNYLIPDALLVNFVRSNWWCYRNPSVFTVARTFAQFGGDDQVDQDEADRIAKEKERIDQAKKLLNGKVPTYKNLDKVNKQADFLINIYKYLRDDRKYEEITGPDWRFDLYVDLLHYLFEKDKTHTNEQKKLIAEHYLRSFDDAIKALAILRQDKIEMFGKILYENLTKTAANHDILLNNIDTTNNISPDLIEKNTNTYTKQIYSSLPQAELDKLNSA